MLDFYGLLTMMAFLSAIAASAVVMIAPVVAAISVDWRFILIYMVYALILCPIVHRLHQDGYTDEDLEAGEDAVEYDPGDDDAEKDG